MRRLFRSLLLVVLAAALGVSTGVAQPSQSPSSGIAGSSGTAGVQSEGLVGQESATTPTSFALGQSDRKVKTLSRVELKRMMLTGPKRAAERTGAGVAVDLQMPSSGPLQQEASNNRTIYYIVGGALVAGGLVAGILALDDGGGGGGQQGIPPPPNRP